MTWWKLWSFEQKSFISVMKNIISLGHSINIAHYMGTPLGKGDCCGTCKSIMYHPTMGEPRWTSIMVQCQPSAKPTTGAVATVTNMFPALHGVIKSCSSLALAVIQEQLILLWAWHGILWYVSAAETGTKSFPEQKCWEPYSLVLLSAFLMLINKCMECDTGV